MSEIWKDIPDFSGFYQISNEGIVRRHAYSFEDPNGEIRYVNAGIQKIRAAKSGYLYIKIGPVHKLIHRLVADAFLPKPRKGQVVTHLDGNKNNNHVSNLKYVTKAKAWKLAQKRKSKNHQNRNNN